jgi:lipopolysaccharide transport system permease protein
VKNRFSRWATENAWMRDFMPWHHRTLIWQMGRRDLVLRYRGSVFGLAWTVLTPLALLGVYTLVFRHVFQFKWTSVGPDSNLEFALNLFAGMLIFQWVSDFWIRAPRLLLEQPNLVTKVVFPLPVLAWSSLLAVSAQALAALCIWMVACVAVGHAPHAGWLFLPLVPISLLPHLLGIGWLLCSLGVYLRDTGQVIGLGLTGLLFLSPVFYPLSALPGWLTPYAATIPIAAPIEALRAMILLRISPDLIGLGGVFASGLVVALLGMLVMHRLRNGFADVI